MTNLIAVEWSEQRLLTNKQVAAGLNCSADLLKHLFRNHKEEFKEGVHFILLQGDTLRTFRRYGKNLPPADSPFHISKFANTLYLWTCQGAARLSKLIDTPEAWQLFTKMERECFEPKIVEPLPVQDSLFPDVESIKPKKRRPAPKIAVVYVVEFDNATCKIGFTGNLTERIDKLMELTKLDYSRWFATAPMSIEDVRQLESSLKARFADYHLQAEFYSAPFDDIKATLMTSPDHRVDKLIAIADRLEPCPERNQLLLQAATLINGKKPF